MVEDMEFFLEKIIKKTNPEEYIKILEQDREDFAEEINRLNNIIDKAVEYIEMQRYNEKNNIDSLSPYEVDRLLEILKGDNK